MMVTALATGFDLIGYQKMMIRSTTTQSLLRAWEGLTSQISANGTVYNVCMGTGIQDNFTQYDQRGTDYWQSSPGGVGVVLRAAVALKSMLRKM